MNDITARFCHRNAVISRNNKSAGGIKYAYRTAAFDCSSAYRYALVGECLAYAEGLVLDEEGLVLDVQSEPAILQRTGKGYVLASGCQLDNLSRNHRGFIGSSEVYRFPVLGGKLKLTGQFIHVDGIGHVIGGLHLL